MDAHICDLAERAEALAEPFEGFSSKPYLDTIANPPRWTIGFGSVYLPDGSNVTADTPSIDLETARKWMAHELIHAALTIASLVKVKMTDDETVALMDMIYNIGSGNFASSTLLRKLNAGDFRGAADEIDKWCHSGGEVVAGLLRRREAETALFLTPDTQPSYAGRVPAAMETTNA